MVEGFHPVRYSVITEKNPREIVMLVGDGCKWRKCRFCNYHLDFSRDREFNYGINEPELLKVEGIYGKLEVINSGSFVDLDEKTMELIKKVCIEKNIHEIHFECHWMHKNEILEFKKMFQKIGVEAVIKIGVETFDYDYRENILVKGIDEKDPAKIGDDFDEVCLLQGLSGQTKESMIRDIETGLQYFKRVCVNIMVENGMPVKPDLEVIKIFRDFVYPKYINNDRVDILMENTEFGVGENQYDE